MGDWSDYFEDFPEENPANQRRDTTGDALRERVAREATYSPKVLAQIAESRKLREAAELRLLGMRLKDRERAQAELHRSIGGLMEAYAWFDVNLGLKIKTHSNSDAEVLALLKPSVPMKLRLDRLKLLIEQASIEPDIQSQNRWRAWITQAEAIRLLRNDYAHGRWVYNSDLRVRGFYFAPLSWETDSQTPKTAIAVSPALIDERSEEIWELTRSIDVVTQPFFPN